MMRGYHQSLIERADAAASSGSLWTIYAAMQRDAAVWVLPALLAVVICLMFNLSGTSSLWVSLPLVGISLFGCVIYVGTIYGRAIKRRTNGS